MWVGKRSYAHSNLGFSEALGSVTSLTLEPRRVRAVNPHRGDSKAHSAGLEWPETLKARKTSLGKEPRGETISAKVESRGLSQPCVPRWCVCAPDLLF